MRQRRRTLKAALALGAAGVLMAAGPVHAEDSGGEGQMPGLPQVPGVPSEAPSGIPTDIPTDVPGGGLPSVPGLPGAATGGGSGGETGGEATGGSTGGSDTGGGDTGGGDTGGTTGGGGGASKKGKDVKIPYTCTTPIGEKKATSTVRIDAAESSGSYDLTVKFSAAVMESPAELPKDSLKPSMQVKVGGDDKGTVKVVGPGNKEPIKQGEQVKISDMKGTYKPGAKGTATLSAGVLTIKAMGTTTTCTPDSAPKPSVEVETADEGGVSGGSSASGGAAAAGGAGDAPQTSGGSGGGLAETGAEDNGGLQALGLVAGTVILLGGAVFTFTPWRKLRGVR